MDEQIKINPDDFEKKSKDELKKELSDLEYAVTMESATESPYTGQYWDSFEEGVYVDITTGEPLFSSKDKFKSHCGWPSFSKPIESEVTRYYKDNSHLVERIEVRSRVGDAHLGHVFPDGPSELGGLRYCINSASIRFIKKQDLEKEGYKVEDRQKIASVFYNRIKKNMMLQTDISVLYALGEHKEVVTLKDLEVNSPYNLYRNRGMGPGPFNSPSEEAILAAIDPAQTDYEYFVADIQTKEVYFAKTYEEHLALKAKYVDKE